MTPLYSTNTKAHMEKYKIEPYSKRSTPSVSLINSTVYWGKVIGYCLIGAVLLISISCNSSRNVISSEAKQNEWEIVKTQKNDSPSWIIYTRKMAGTNFLEYKIEGEIDSSAKACISSFRQDIYNQAADVENKKFPTYQIVRESKDSLSTYVIHKEPFPLRNTEMSVRYTFYDHSDGSTGVRWIEAWDECQIQPSKKLKRVETFRGLVSFAPTSGHSCRAVNSVNFDPKGMPLWLVEPMVFKFLRNGLEDLREVTTEL